MDPDELVLAEETDDAAGVSPAPSPGAPLDQAKPVWHAARPGQWQIGPVNFADLRQRAALQTLAPGDWLWREGFAAWVEARTVPGVFGDPNLPPPLPAARSPGTPFDAAMTVATTPLGPLEIRLAGRAFGVAAGLVLLVSVLLSYWGRTWFAGAALLAIPWMLAEVGASLLESRRP